MFSLELFKITNKLSPIATIKKTKETQGCPNEFFVFLNTILFASAYLLTSSLTNNNLLITMLIAMIVNIPWIYHQYKIPYLVEFLDKKSCSVCPSVFGLILHTIVYGLLIALSSGHKFPTKI